MSCTFIALLFVLFLHVSWWAVPIGVFFDILRGI
jgi:hypothetical protein